MGASRGSGARLLGFLADVQARGATEALRSLDLEGLAGRPIDEVFMGLADYICPNAGTVDEGIAREAFIETIVDLSTLGSCGWLRKVDLSGGQVGANSSVVILALAVRAQGQNAKAELRVEADTARLGGLQSPAILDNACAGVAARQSESISRASKSARFSTVEVTVKYDVPTSKSKHPCGFPAFGNH